MSRMERLWEIERLLRVRRAVPLATMVEETGVSRATIVRDLTYLKDRLQAPIRWDRTLRGYRLEGPSSMPAIYFSGAEIHALLVLRELVARIQPSVLREELEPLKKLLQKLAGDARAGDDEMTRRIRMVQIASRPVSAEHFQIVCTALLERVRLELTYYSRTRDAGSHRIISPQRLVHYRDNWYMDAWCHSREALRSFALDAIQEAAIRPERALEIADEQLDRELGTGYGIFAGGEVRTAILRFSPKMARWVSREKWHSHQRGRFEADGSFTMELPYSGEQELVMDIMRFGPEVEVLGPEELRRSVSANLRKTLSLYGSRT
jgi:predicted DNA-binding transcriptional regulator YafY